MGNGEDWGKVEDSSPIEAAVSQRPKVFIIKEHRPVGRNLDFTGIISNDETFKFKVLC